MKYLILSITFIAICAMSYKTTDKTIYQFKVADIYGEEFDFSSLNGKKIMIVNTASKCGFTPQFEKMEALYQKYKDQNFIIIGFPANNFMKQEPGNNEEIESFCKKNYGVSFPMMGKISVKGEDTHPLYTFLTSKEQNGVLESKVKWNFQKYLINEDGTLHSVFYSSTNPDDETIVSWIEG